MTENETPYDSSRQRYDIDRYDPEFDHVFEVFEDGTVGDTVEGVWAPYCYGGDLGGDSWEFVSSNYTRQDSYCGPIMHASELFVGNLYLDVMDSPGIYCLVVSECDHSEAEVWGCERDSYGEFTGDCEPDGWAVVRYTVND